MDCVVCDSSTGAIIRTLTVSRNDFAAQAGEGEFVASAPQSVKTALMLAASADKPPPFAVDVTSPALDIAPPDEVAHHLETVEAFGEDIKAWQEANPVVEAAPVDQPKPRQRQPLAASATTPTKDAP